jgi:hypothetical protein
MNQIERVRKHLSNLITGIAVGGAPTQTAASGKRWRTIPLKTRCLGWQFREDQRLARTAVCSDWCAICFRTKRSEGKNFEIKGGIKNQAFRNFGFWLTTASKVGRRCWTTGIIACERSNEGRKIQ